MRARRSRRPPARLGLNLTSMIDVVFLLLVYFMAATDFKLGEEIYRLDLPQRGSDPFELPRDPLRVAVTSIGDENYVIRLEGPETARGRPTTFKELFEFLAGNRRYVADTAGLQALALSLSTLFRDNPALGVNLRADRHTDYRWVEPVFQAVSAAARLSGRDDVRGRVNLVVVREQ